jgi:hypothetical protein
MHLEQCQILNTSNQFLLIFDNITDDRTIKLFDQTYKSSFINRISTHSVLHFCRYSIFPYLDAKQFDSFDNEESLTISKSIFSILFDALTIQQNDRTCVYLSTDLCKTNKAKSIFRSRNVLLIDGTNSFITYNSIGLSAYGFFAENK